MRPRTSTRQNMCTKVAACGAPRRAHSIAAGTGPATGILTVGIHHHQQLGRRYTFYYEAGDVVPLAEPDRIRLEQIFRVFGGRATCQSPGTVETLILWFFGSWWVCTGSGAAASFSLLKLTLPTVDLMPPARPVPGPRRPPGADDPRSSAYGHGCTRR
jgi:hypothetical protein